MDIKVNEYAKIHNISTSTVYKWLNKGYLGEIKKIKGKSGRLCSVIPDDMPVPYKFCSNTQTDTQLELDLLMAANGHHSVFATLFKKIHTDRYLEVLYSLENQNKIIISEPYPSINQIKLTPEYRQVILDFELKNKKIKLDSIFKLCIKNDIRLEPSLDFNLLKVGI